MSTKRVHLPAPRDEVGLHVTQAGFTRIVLVLAKHATQTAVCGASPARPAVLCRAGKFMPWPPPVGKASPRMHTGLRAIGAVIAPHHKERFSALKPT